MKINKNLMQFCYKFKINLLIKNCIMNMMIVQLLDLRCSKPNINMQLDHSLGRFSINNG